MSLREHLQNGTGRFILTAGGGIVAFVALWWWWPTDKDSLKSLVEGIQKVAFVAAAFAVTAYNLRTRVVDLVLKIEGDPVKVEEFCERARTTGKRLTNLVVLFTATATSMGLTALFPNQSLIAKSSVLVATCLFAVSSLTFLYIIFAFEQLERMALDEAEENARRKEAARLFKSAEPLKA